ADLRVIGDVDEAARQRAGKCVDGNAREKQCGRGCLSSRLRKALYGKGRSKPAAKGSKRKKERRGKEGVACSHARAKHDHENRAECRSAGNADQAWVCKRVTKQAWKRSTRSGEGRAHKRGEKRARQTDHLDDRRHALIDFKPE